MVHIYPISLRGHSGEARDIWESLRTSWTQDRVDKWYKSVFPEGEFVDVCHNMLSLSPNAHRYYGKGYFALKPIALSEDKKCLTVKFYWLVKGQYSESVRLCDPPMLEGRDRGPGSARLYNQEKVVGPGTPLSDVIIQSGDEIRITTEDPDNCPLPHWHLLEMQWTLNRLVAMSGAADVDSEFDDDDDDQELFARNDDLDASVSGFESECHRINWSSTHILSSFIPKPFVHSAEGHR